ncbi:MAG: hypothetical protein A2X19_05655 [Bacteroidetes bacterium GWE2_39_28]|nr:MAG: hypothetical protein A2X19_05655 [Bacteroidetes bacterium GWE2_39_28]OFZ10963.1 MAG: hypothetical protein A2465_00465 [Bacteroidetes bacterium RIFOXYC2_FULL_39_11]HCT93793.1 hypothetical protein [Rikenellaceae bacterium]HCV15076.1 hypothetical protein [Rikenellaceae bacterium]
MKRASIKFILLIGTLSIILSACGPVTEIINVEARIPAEIPIDFSGKAVAVFTSVRNSEPNDSMFFYNDSTLMLHMATGIASAIEKNLAIDEGGVYVFKHFPDDSTEYDMPYIHSLSFSSNSDIIIIVDSVQVGNVGIINGVTYNSAGEFKTSYIYAPYQSIIKAYDAISTDRLAYINQRDTVFWEIISRNDLRPEAMAIRARQSMPSVSQSIGAEVVKALFPAWQEQKRTLYYFPFRPWVNAIDNAREFRWREAMEFWLKQTKDKDPVKAAAAAYNVAIACELTDRHELALQWAEFSLKVFKLPGVSEYKQLLTDKLEKSTR